MFIKSTESFLETLEKTFNSKYDEEMEPKKGLEYTKKHSYFELKLFSEKRFLKKHCVEFFMNMYNVSERST